MFTTAILQLCYIIIRPVLVILLLVSSWNFTPVVKYHFTCKAPRHKKVLWLSCSTDTCRRVWLDVVAPEREHC